MESSPHVGKYSGTLTGAALLNRAQPKERDLLNERSAWNLNKIMHCLRPTRLQLRESFLEASNSSV
jgi:hypothetical protein